MQPRDIVDVDDYLCDVPGDPLKTPEQRRQEALFPWAEPDAVPMTPVVPSVIAGRSIPEIPPDAGRFFESCPVRGAVSVVAGGVMGFVVGMFLSNYERLQPPVTAPGQPEPPKVPLSQSLKEGLLQMRNKGMSWARNFAIVGGVYATVECFIEAKRGRHDLTNSVAGGCVTGAALAVRSGPTAMCLGCAGFAAFSVVIDKVMDPDL